MFLIIVMVILSTAFGFYLGYQQGEQDMLALCSKSDMEFISRLLIRQEQFLKNKLK